MSETRKQKIDRQRGRAADRAFQPIRDAIDDGRLTITAMVCGTALCTDGRPHDDLKMIVLRDEEGRAVGGSAACSRCGSSAMDRDMLRLP